MNTQNPTQTAQKIKEGCGNKLPNFGEGSHTCGTKCVNPSNGILLCLICKAILTAKKEEWQNEIEFLESILNNQSQAMKENINRLCIPVPSRRNNSFTSITLDMYIRERLELLKKAVEIANG